MELLGVAHGRIVAGALLRHHVHEHGGIGGQHHGERLLERADVVAVDGAVHRMPSCSKIMVRGSTNCFMDSLHVAPEVRERLAEGAALSSLSWTESRVWRYCEEARM